MEFIRKFGIKSVLKASFFSVFLGLLIIGALFVATESVQSAVYFMIMFICIQQVEGNFIYPNVVGRSVGFPPMYVIVAVTVGASLGGILGIIISIPVCSCIYQLVKEDVVMRLKVKKHSTTSS